MTITLLLAALRVTKLCYASNVKSLGINTARRGLVLAMVKGSNKACIYANWMSWNLKCQPAHSLMNLPNHQFLTALQH